MGGYVRRCCWVSPASCAAQRGTILAMAPAKADVVKGGGSSFGGGSMVERNLDRATVFFAVLFVVNTLVLLKI